MFVAAYLVFVSQTRSLILGTIACVISMFFLEKRSSSKKLIVQLLLLAIFVIAVNMGFADTILNKMNITISLIVQLDIDSMNLHIIALFCSMENGKQDWVY